MRYSKTKHVDYQRINERIDTTLRDVEIKAMWKGLQFSTLKYEEKLYIITDTYNISDKSVESIINESLISRLK